MLQVHRFHIRCCSVIACSNGAIATAIFSMATNGRMTFNVSVDSVITRKTLSPLVVVDKLQSKSHHMNRPS